ncbi:tRNA-intron lyase [Candidatus Woesearchaeota archaeon]|nr:tRNA-intron lyase [Candidatus Woesearchaeota archaeon]
MGDKEIIKEEKIKVRKFVADFLTEKVSAQDKGSARELYDSSRYGEPKEGKIVYSLVEALYLVEKGKMNVKDGKKNLKFDTLLKNSKKTDPNIWLKYLVYRDMRGRGYIVKTALKFGADFRVYDRGVKPGEDHAKWVLFPVHEGNTLTWHEFSAKNRVAHSTRKRLLLGIVDAEEDVTYYEIKWTRP